MKRLTRGCKWGRPELSEERKAELRRLLEEGLSDYKIRAFGFGQGTAQKYRERWGM
jgi:hypothetical protein